MKLKLQRIKSTEEATLGVLTLDNEFHSFTCEDEKREVKVKGETRIPSGTYKIKHREVLSGKTKRYREKYDWFTWHLELQDVPNFEYVYMHIGNDETHTDGCIIMAETADSKAMTIGRSTPAFKDLYLKVSHALAYNQDVEITVFDEDYLHQPF